MRGDTYYQWFIEETDFGNRYRLLLAKMIDGDVMQFLQGDTWMPHEPGHGIYKPTLELNHRQMEGLASTILEWAGKRNMRTEPEAKLQGQLEATKYHLEDMRTLLKLGGKK